MLERITIEENSDRTKIVIPIQRQWAFWGTYTTMLVGWIAGSIWAIGALFSSWRAGMLQSIDTAFLITYIIILVVIAAGWYWVGQRVWRNWQYHTANREILFFYPDKLIVRRPVSLLGVTEAYDIRYISPFRVDPKVESLAFDYGTYRVPVGGSLNRAESDALGQVINNRFFPHHDAEEDDDDDGDF